MNTNGDGHRARRSLAVSPCITVHHRLSFIFASPKKWNPEKENSRWLCFLWVLGSSLRPLWFSSLLQERIRKIQPGSHNSVAARGEAALGALPAGRQGLFYGIPELLEAEGFSQKDLGEIGVGARQDLGLVVAAG